MKRRPPPSLLASRECIALSRALRSERRPWSVEELQQATALPLADVESALVGLVRRGVAVQRTGPGGGRTYTFWLHTTA